MNCYKPGFFYKRLLGVSAILNHLSMAAEAHGRLPDERKRATRSALDPLITDASASGPSKLELVQKAFLAPFSHKKRDSTRILSDRMYQFVRPILV